MYKLDGCLPIARREDDVPLFTPWKVLLDPGLSIYISNVVGIIEHQEPLACAFLS